MEGLDAIFMPQSIAVLGASQTPGKVGHDIFANILRGGYRGTLHPVNPTAASILCVKAYRTVLDIPDPIDLAIVILPPKQALPATLDSVKKGVKGIIIVSAGFREAGGEGLEIENRIRDICREAKIRLIGPNCLGVINPIRSVSMNASFSARMPAAGGISFISQSGALCTAVLDFAHERDFGFSKFISTGNKADVDELDLLRYLHNDPDTKVVMIYLEELRRGPEFIEAVKQITAGTRPMPVLAIKSGRPLRAHGRRLPIRGRWRDPTRSMRRSSNSPGLSGPVRSTSCSTMQTLSPTSMRACSASRGEKIRPGTGLRSSPTRGDRGSWRPI